MAESKNWPLLRVFAEAVKRGITTIEKISEKYRADVQAIIAGELSEKK